MKYLITGGCGFLGCNLSSEVIKRGEELLIFDNLSRFGSSENLLWLKSIGVFQFIHGDIRNFNDIYNVINNFKPDMIFHLAGQVAMTTSISNPRLDFEVNALGSFNLLESIRMISPESIIVYSSSNKVYGDFEWIKFGETETRYLALDFPHGFDESINLDFHSPYGCSKGCADQYMLDYARIFGLKTVVFRHSSMYGGRQYATYDQGWIGWFCQQALLQKNGILNEPFTISGNGKQVRDVLHADDIKKLYLSVPREIDKLKGKAFNIGSGVENSLSLLELFDFLNKNLNIKMNFIKIKERESDQKVFIANTRKIKDAITWNITMPYSDGILNMIQWLKESYMK